MFDCYNGIIYVLLQLCFAVRDAIHQDTRTTGNDLESDFLGVGKGFRRVDLGLQPYPTDAVLVSFFQNRFGDGGRCDDGDKVLRDVAWQGGQILNAAEGLDGGLLWVHRDSGVAILDVPAMT